MISIILLSTIVLADFKAVYDVQIERAGRGETKECVITHNDKQGWNAYIWEGGNLLANAESGHICEKSRTQAILENLKEPPEDQRPPKILSSIKTNKIAPTLTR